MTIKAYRVMSLICGGVVLGILPSCTEEFILNLVTPILLAH